MVAGWVHRSGVGEKSKSEGSKFPAQTIWQRMHDDTIK